MYIGPWQEYKLSQARRPQPSQGLASDSPDIRGDLQRTLLQTLSPQDVAKVMAAMNPLLSGAAEGQAALPPLPSGRRHQSRRPRRAAERAQPTLHEQFRLPAVDTKYRVDAASPGANGTPQSVRSSKSEPLHSSRVIQRARNEVRAFSPPVSARSTGYDSSNLVATLRLERRSRPTLGDTARKTDFGQFWGWKKDGATGDAGSDSGAGGGMPSKADSSIENKIARVRNMQKVYTTKPEPFAPPPVERIAINVSSSPLRTYQKPQTPVVQDRDLTRSDLDVVSKYFNANRSSSGLAESAASPKPTGATATPPKPLSLPIDDTWGDEEVAEANENENNVQQYQDHSRIICSPVQVMDTPIGGNYNSPDGLLHWTAMLNVDEIDSLY